MRFVRAKIAILVSLVGCYAKMENLTLNGCGRHPGLFPQAEVRKGQTRRRRLSRGVGARASRIRSVNWTLGLEEERWRAVVNGE